jgi:hypothetical protein
MPMYSELRTRALPAAQHLAMPQALPEYPETSATLTPAEHAAELLRKAAYRVGQPHAWTQHYLGRLKSGAGTFTRGLLRADEMQSYCMLGALYSECDREPQANIHTVYDALVEALGTPLLADWNDAPQRTQMDVVGALLRAAEIVEAR